MTKYLLLISYIILTFWVGKEFHPFSKFPMYCAFPNWAYVFYLKNEKGEIVSFGKNFSENKNAGYITHTYSSFFNFHNYQYGFGKEDSAQLKEAGNELITMILKDENQAKFNFDTLRLYKRFYSLENNQLHYRDDLIGERPLKQ